MSDVDIPHPKGNMLTGKLGPLPVWAWGAIIGGGALAFYLLRNRQSATVTANATTGEALDTVADPWTGPTTGTSNAAPVNPDSSTGGTTDNQSWLNLAISGTANKLSASPSAVSSVLSRYLYDGGSFTKQEQTYIDTAIQLYGAPPQGTGASSSFPSSATSGQPAKGQYQIQTVQKAGGQKALRFVNTATGKQTSINGSSDASGLLSWIQSINNGSGSANVRTADIAAYRAKVD